MPQTKCGRGKGASRRKDPLDVYETVTSVLQRWGFLRQGVVCAAADIALDDLATADAPGAPDAAGPSDAWASIPTCSQEQWIREVESGDSVLLDVRNDLEFKSRCGGRSAQVQLRL